MVNTKELMAAYFEASTKEETWNCRNLATSISERSPWAWKLYYSGEAAEILSQKSLKALETVMKRVEKSDERIWAKRKLEFEEEEEKKYGGGASTSKPKRVDFLRSRVRGAKITDTEFEGEEKTMALKLPREKEVSGFRVCEGEREKEVMGKGVSGCRRSSRIWKKNHVEEGKEKEVGDEKRVVVCGLAVGEFGPQKKD